jgi:hypothetical protein
MRKGISSAILIGVALLGLTACKEIDVVETGAVKVKGTDDLWWFCDGSTLIYVEKHGGDDEYIAFFSWGCDDKGKPTKELPGHLGEEGDSK